MTPRRKRVAGDAEALEQAQAPPAKTLRATTAARSAESAGRIAAGVVEVLGNGSAFLRVDAAGALRRGRLHLRRAGSPLRARLRRSRHRPGAHAAALRALPVAGARRHDQRRSPRTPSSDGVRYDELPVDWPRERLALGSQGPDARGDRVAHPDRPRLARGDRRRPSRRQDRDAAPAAGRRRTDVTDLDVSARARRRAA